MTPEELVRRIDWETLRQQKSLLIELAAKATSPEQRLADGLVALLDEIQDCAVDELGISQEQVFPDLRIEPYDEATSGSR